MNEWDIRDCKTFNILSIFIISIQLHYGKTKKIIKLIKFIYLCEYDGY